MMQVEGNAEALLDALATRPPSRHTYAYVCAACGYGAVLAYESTRCPMCGQHDWQLDRRSVFSRLGDPPSQPAGSGIA